MRHTAFLHNEVPGITIPEAIQAQLTYAGDEAKYEGVRIAVASIAKMRARDSGWIAGVYLMPAFNRYDLAAEIVEACHTT